MNYKDFGDWWHTTQGSGHGRQEQRRCIALACQQEVPFDAWKGLRTMAMVESMRQTENGVSSEKRFYISSLAPDPEKLAQAIRAHWQIENRLHWCLDVTFHEDACRMRIDHAPENLNIVRKIAMNLLRLSPLKKTLPKKRLRAFLNHQYLEEMLGVAQ
jgi:predicted transposase YbfD/YdcC